MKKILLVLFLCSFASNVSAKVEIWLCNSKYGIDIFKLDTIEPLNSSQKIDGDWKKFYTLDQDSPVSKIIYDPNQDHIRIIYRIEQTNKEIIFDFVNRELIKKFQDKSKSNSKWSCELK